MNYTSALPGIEPGYLIGYDHPVHTPDGGGIADSLLLFPLMLTANVPATPGI